MQLQLSTWIEVEAYLQSSKAIIIPMGSTEQHGPSGLIGTDAICAEVVARAAGDEAGFLVAPTFNVGQAQHHMAFAGSMTLRPSTMIAAMVDWANSLKCHGFTRLYWLNGHGGNIATINAAFGEIYHAQSFAIAGSAGSSVRCQLRNWWELEGVQALVKDLYPQGEGHHATPSEVAVTQFAYPQAIKGAALSPRIAPIGDFTDAADYRRTFPDGRIGSDPAQASPEHGKRFVEIATKALIAEFAKFAAS